MAESIIRNSFFNNLHPSNIRTLIHELFSVTLNGTTHTVGITGIEVTYYGNRKFIIGSVLGGDYFTGDVLVFENHSDSASGGSWYNFN